MSKCERESRKTAALLAACASTEGNSALTASATRSKRSSCSSKKADSGSSAVARWVQTPASSRPGSASQARASSSTSPASAVPRRPMPLSNLTWTRAGRPWARARSARWRRNPSRQTPTSEPAERTMSVSAAVTASIVSSGMCWKRRPDRAGSAGVEPGRRVREDGGARRGERLQAAGEQCRRDAGEDVAAARGRQARGGYRIDGDAPPVGDDRVVSLEDDDGPGDLGRLPGRGEAVGGDQTGVAPQQAPQLTGVRSEDRRGAAISQLSEIA